MRSSIHSRVQSILDSALKRVFGKSAEPARHRIDTPQGKPVGILASARAVPLAPCNTQHLYALVQELMVLAAASGRLAARIAAMTGKDEDLELEEMFFKVMKAYYKGLRDKEERDV